LQPVNAIALKAADRCSWSVASDITPMCVYYLHEPVQAGSSL